MKPARCCKKIYKTSKTISPEMSIALADRILTSGIMGTSMFQTAIHGVSLIPQ
jgi:hypothetical protein